ncbi:MAG: DUF4446 family protein [Candidatus Levybacteria bacterium]|nr:DUF4446 family protein [Candidatus Levybacteria bacterium]
MTDVFFPIILLLFLFWLIVLSYLYFSLKRHYDRMIKGATSESLSSVLDKIVGDIQSSKKDIAQLVSDYDKIEKEGSFHIQKIGLLRFNPFKDTGGDQSFILSFLDSHDTGLIISGLYSRSGTRWYAKKVIKGKGVDYDLSDEERKALDEAKKIEVVHEK